MKALKVVWGLFVDDTRLAAVLIISLILAFVLSCVHQPLVAALIIWVGLIVSLWISVEHQLKLKKRS